MKGYRQINVAPHPPTSSGSAAKDFVPLVEEGREWKSGHCSATWHNEQKACSGIDQFNEGDHSGGRDNPTVQSGQWKDTPSNRQWERSEYPSRQSTQCRSLVPGPYYWTSAGGSPSNNRKPGNIAVDTALMPQAGSGISSPAASTSLTSCACWHVSHLRAFPAVTLVFPEPGHWYFTHTYVDYIYACL